MESAAPRRCSIPGYRVRASGRVGGAELSWARIPPKEECSRHGAAGNDVRSARSQSEE
jgi:hypothetical protein